MNFKLDTLVLGIIEIFAVLLPGALLTYFLYGKVGDKLFGSAGQPFPPISEDVHTVVFLAVSYMVGHFVNALGSKILDDYFYDRGTRKKMTKNYNLTLAVAKDIRKKYLDTPQLLSTIWKADKRVRTIFVNKNKSDDKTPDEDDVSDEAIAVFLENDKSEIINTFQWTKRVLAIAQPDILTELQQAEAKQKFFRSLSVVFTLIALGTPIATLLKVGLSIDNGWGSISIISFSLLLLAYFSVKLYTKLRFKNTELAYQALIALEYYEPKNTPKTGK